MNYVKFLLALAVTLTFVLTPSSTFAEDQDTDKDIVVLIDGRVVKGKVFSSTYKEVKLASQTIDAREVSHITYFDTPPDYIEALDMIERGEYENAKFKLKLALEAKNVRDWLKLYVEIQRAEIMWRQNMWTEARKKYRELNKDYPESFFLRMTSWRIPLTLMKQNNYKNAEQAFEDIVNDPRFRDEPIHWRAWFWKIFTIELRDENREAYQQYLNLGQKCKQALPLEVKQAMIKNDPISEKHKGMVKIYLEATYRGYVNMAISGKVREAYKEFDELSDKSSKMEKAIGIIGKAICDVVEIANAGEINRENLDKLDKARLELAKSNLMYASNNDRRADLFYWAGKAALLADDKEQAVSYFKMVATQYPASLISKACEKELDKLGVEPDVPEEKAPAEPE
ncbi:MAG: tetratricopeptide repeat protein [Planctomycetota bacterium]|nr:tetratricopeptide repeat protein [Planctomycetota bacterium]